MAGAATFRRITGNIAEIANLLALWTNIRWIGSCEGVATVLAPPKSQVAAGTNIPDEFP